MKRFKILFFILAFTSGISHTQITGTIIDRFTNEKLQGASISILGKNIGTLSDLHGQFKIDALSGEVLIISYVGYRSKQIDIEASSHFDISLEPDSKELDEIIITGVFDQRKRIESSVAITTILNTQLNHMVPNSATELLRLVPGVFVNSARGEIGNAIYSRGMFLNSNYFYVSMQEDGLPVVPFAGSIGPDRFLRADINILKIEAVRGGSASILGVNAPGGIFNYISKSGSTNHEFNINARLGLEGNIKNPYYRLEAGLGGPLTKSKHPVTYYIGGHYRYDLGSNYPGYPLNRGGMIKGSIQKSYTKGSLKLFGKWLDDHATLLELLPATDFDHPGPAGNFKNNSSLLVQDLEAFIPSTGTGIRFLHSDTKNLNHLTEQSIGMQWEYRITDRLKTNQTFKMTSQRSYDEGAVLKFPFKVDEFGLFHYFADAFGLQGTYHFYNNTTKQSYGTLKQEFAPFPVFTADLHLPGSEVIQNGLLFTPLGIEDKSIKHLQYQGQVSRSSENMKFIIGNYTSVGKFNTYLLGPSAATFSTIEERPQIINVDFIPLDPNAPKVKLFDQNGLTGYAINNAQSNSLNLLQTAFFAGHQWQINPKLFFDWGVRWEYFKFKNNWYETGYKTVSTPGGVDHDPLTWYDNREIEISERGQYSKNISTLSGSAGINYKINKYSAFYSRLSLGNKIPEISTYITNKKSASVSRELAQKISQIEAGWKYAYQGNELSVTPFYSDLYNVPEVAWDADTGRSVSYYSTPVVYNHVSAIGLELEGNLNLYSDFRLRLNAVIQKFYVQKYQSYLLRDKGPQDDTLINFSHKKISEGTPPVIFNITPSYSHNRWYIDINWYHMAKRAANIYETFYLPSIHQFDLHISYRFNKRITLRATLNNLFNTYGVMEWTAPIHSGNIFETFNKSQFTPDQRKQDPNAVFYTVGIQPRAFFLDLAVKL